MAQEPVPSSEQSESAFPAEHLLYSHVVKREDLYFSILLFLPSLLIWLVQIACGISALRPQVEPMLTWGATYGPATLGGDYWRWITCTFLHFGLVHIASNGAALIRIGPLVSGMIGRKETFLLYAGSGLMGSLFTTIYSPAYVGAGASGAIMGLFGAFFPVALAYPKLRKLSKGAIGGVAVSVVLVLGNGITNPSVGNAAHIGGLLFGMVGGALIAFRAMPYARLVVPVSALVAALLVGVLAPRDIDVLRIAFDYDRKFGLELQAIRRIETELNAGKPPTLQMLDEVAKIRPLLAKQPELALGVLSAARSSQAKGHAAGVSAQILSNRIAITGLETVMRAYLEWNPAELANFKVNSKSIDELLKKLAGLQAMLAAGRSEIITDLATVQKLGEEHQLGTGALQSSGGKQSLAQIDAASAQLSKVLPVVVGAAAVAFEKTLKEAADLGWTFDKMNAETWRELSQECAAGSQAITELVRAVIEDPIAGTEVQKAPDAAAIRKSLGDSQVMFGYYAAYFAMLSQWRAKGGQKMSAADAEAFRAEILEKLLAVRATFNELFPGAEPVASVNVSFDDVSHFTTVTGGLLTAECVHQRLLAGAMPVWSEASPGSCQNATVDRALASLAPAESQAGLSPNITKPHLIVGSNLDFYKEALRSGRFNELSGLSEKDKQGVLSGALSAAYFHMPQADGKANEVSIEVNGKLVAKGRQGDPKFLPGFAYAPGKETTIKIKIMKVAAGKSTLQFFEAPDGRSLGGKLKAGDTILWKGVIP